MNAQQKLAHLLGNDTERDKSPARRFLRDHGPAIAELIEADRILETSQGGVERGAAYRRRTAALRKLTQEATT